MKNYYIKFMFLKIVIALLNHYFQLTHLEWDSRRNPIKMQ